MFYFIIVFLFFCSFYSIIIYMHKLLFVWYRLTVRKIYQDRSAGSVSWYPYFFMLLNCVAWVAYGVSLLNAVVLIVNFFGVLVACLYLWVFYVVGSEIERLRIFRYSALGLAAEMVTLVLVFLFVNASFTTAAGLLGCSLAISMFASPLLQVYVVVQTQSTSSLSLPLCLAAGLNTVAWTAFAVLTQDLWIFAPNFIGLVLTGLQIALFVRYWGSANVAPLPQ
jgi:solute carrier family 50 protein (sugar transporter)